MFASCARQPARQILREALGFVLRNLRWDVEEDLSTCRGRRAWPAAACSWPGGFAGWQAEQGAKNLAASPSPST
jgi:hypothetical protein